MRPKWQLIAAISLAVVLIGATVGLAFSYFQKPAPVKKAKVVVTPKKPKPKPKMALCPLDGGEVEQNASRPLAIMVENLTTIRPQAGLNGACIVVEGLSEGGITRFMLVYGAGGAENIGPVRSARTHFVALARGWDALFGHVGGSIYAMREIKNWGVFDWDQSSHGSSYQRVGWTRAPHNVFTSSTKIRAAAAASDPNKNGLASSAGLKFKAAPALENRPQGFKKVLIDFSDPGYLVEYQYDRENNTYKRFNGGKPHTDANNSKQVTPTNIVIIYAPTSPIPGGSKVLDVNVIGKGTARVIRDGVVINGIWEKPTYDSPLFLREEESGEDIPLSPGQTWIEIVTPTTPVTIEQ